MNSKPIQERDFFNILRNLHEEKDETPREKELDLKARLEAKRELFDLMCKGGYLTSDCTKDLQARIYSALSELDSIMKVLDEETLP